jgi:hypothetical protein
MNFLEAVAQLFPDGVIVRDATRTHVEVHDLARNAVPRNCEIVASGQFQYDHDQGCRNSYLIRIEKFVLLVRTLPIAGSHRKLYAEVTLRSTQPG